MKNIYTVLLCVLLFSAGLLQAQPGGWSVDVPKFDYNMTAVAELYLDGTPLTRLDNQVGAFYNEEVRSYSPAYLVEGKALFFLTLYSSQYEGEKLYFKVFVGATQRLYESVDSIAFRHNRRLGEAQPYRINLLLSQRPLIYSAPRVQYRENSCPNALDVQASDNADGEGSGLTFSINGGADAGKFAINAQTGVLSWSNFTPSFDAPGDINGDNRYEVTVRVTDSSNRYDEQTVVIEVVASAAPGPLACPSNKTANTADDGTGDCSTTVAGLLVAGVGTLCDAGTLSYQLTGATLAGGAGQVPVNQAFAKGVTTVQYARTGLGAGNCSFTVTVQDNENPALACPTQPILANSPAGNCATAVPYTVSATDNCPNVVTEQTAGLPSGAAFPGGTTVVAWKATDAAGRTATCSFSVVVSDPLPPTITCPGNMVRTPPSGQCSDVVPYSVTASDNCGVATATRVSGPESGGTFYGGTTTVVWKAQDAAGNSTTCAFTVTLPDDQAPNITCPANIIRSSTAGLSGAIVTYSAPTATDNCTTPTVTLITTAFASGATFPIGTSSVVWEASDAAGKTKRCTFTVTVNDTQAPTITCPTNLLRSTDAGQCAAAVTYVVPTASDDQPLPAGQPAWVSGGTAPTASGNNRTSTFQKGLTTVQWRVTDAAGTSRTCTFRVSISDAQAPTLTCPPALSLSTGSGVCTAVVTYTAPSYTDNCVPTSGTAVRVSGPTNNSTMSAGTANVVFRATDAVGNSRTCAMAVTVTDNQLPVVNCPAPLTVTGSGAPCRAAAVYNTPTASDNCAGPLTPFLIGGLSSGSQFPSGVTTNTWRAVTSGGQIGECSFTVTVSCPNARDGGNGLLNAENAAAPRTTANVPLDGTLAPNPATGMVYFNVQFMSLEWGTLSVWDAMGRQVWAQEITEQGSFDTSNWAPGLYWVRFGAASGAVCKTLMVVRGE